MNTESKMKIKIPKQALKVPYMVVEYYREFKIPKQAFQNNKLKISMIVMINEAASLSLEAEQKA